MLWEKFLKTGSIEDYLRYRASEEAKKDVDPERPDNSRGDTRRKQ